MRKKDERVCIVVVEDFLMGAQGAYGISARLWPTAESVRIVFEEQEDAKQGVQPASFEALRYNPSLAQDNPQLHRLLPGGMLRVRLRPNPLTQGLYATSKPSVLTWNQEETLGSMRFGMGHVRLYTPRKIQETLQWLSESSEGRAEVSQYIYARSPSFIKRSTATEAVLARLRAGEPRYVGFLALYEPKAAIKAEYGNEEQIARVLEEFFAYPQFAPRLAPSGELYRPVRPQIVVRGLNAKGALQNVKTLTPKVFQTRQDSQVQSNFLGIRDCVHQVIRHLPKAASWDLLPCKIYPVSMEKMRLSFEPRTLFVHEAGLLHARCHRKQPSGTWEEVGVQMGMKLAQGGSSVVVEMFCAHNAEEIAVAQMTYTDGKPAELPLMDAVKKEDMHKELALEDNGMHCAGF